MIENQDIELLAQRDYELTVNLTEADGVAELDLHGCTITWALSSIYSETALIIKTSADADEILVTDEPNGVLTVFINKEDTLALGGVSYKHEMLVVDALAKESTVLTGKATILKSIAA